MKSCHELIYDQQIVEKLLRTLTPRFDHIVVAIEESKDLSKMKGEELMHSLEAHEQRLLERSREKQQEHALQAHTSHKFEGRNSKHKKGKGKWKGSKGGSRDFNKKHHHYSESSHGEPSHAKKDDSSRERVKRSHLIKEKSSVTTTPSGGILLMSVEMAKEGDISQMMRLTLLKMRALTQKKFCLW